MKEKLLSTLLMVILYLPVSAQGFSIKQCVDYARLNNGNLLNAQYDVDITEKKIAQQIGTMLPQVDASGSYKDNLKLNTTVMPAELMGGEAGKTIAITMGTQHNLSAGVNLSQKIFDPAFSPALKAAKISREQSEQSLQQTEEQVVYNICITYYQALVIRKQADALKATLDASVESLSSIELKLRNGMVNPVDVDKIRVSCNNTRSKLEQSELSYLQSLNSLKYYMGMPVDSAIVLTDTTLVIAEDIALPDPQNFSVENHTDYKLQKSSISMYEADWKKERAGYLPSLSFNAFYDYDAMRDKFNFLSSGQEWYNSYGMGLTLSIPIFDGLQRKNRISQAKLNIRKSEENLRLTEQSLRVNHSNYEIEYRNAVDNIRNEKENLDLALKVYKNTRLSYQQGTGTSLDLVQAESSLREAQSTYFNKLLNLYIARLGLEKSKGNLLEYVNNSK
jgi:outer membrane protein